MTVDEWTSRGRMHLVGMQCNQSVPSRARAQAAVAEDVFRHISSLAQDKVQREFKSPVRCAKGEITAGSGDHAAVVRGLQNAAAIYWSRVSSIGLP